MESAEVKLVDVKLTYYLVANIENNLVITYFCALKMKVNNG